MHATITTSLLFRNVHLLVFVVLSNAIVVSHTVFSPPYQTLYITRSSRRNIEAIARAGTSRSEFPESSSSSSSSKLDRAKSTRRSQARSIASESTAVVVFSVDFVSELSDSRSGRNDDDTGQRSNERSKSSPRITVSRKKTPRVNGRIKRKVVATIVAATTRFVLR